MQIGTYQMAVMAKALNKPFYVVAESFKFVRMYPLNQEDLPNDEKVIAGASLKFNSQYFTVSPPLLMSWKWWCKLCYNYIL